MELIPWSLDKNYFNSGVNSYVTLEYAASVMDQRLHNSEWGAASDDDKKKALTWATRQLDYTFDWRGRKKEEDQPLQFPRYGLYDRDDWYIDDESIPVQLKLATSEYALELLREERTLTQEPPYQGIGGISLGSLSLQFDPHDRKMRVPDYIKNYVIAFIRSDTEGVKLVKVGRA